MAQSSGFSHGLAGLRGAAALGVLLYHAMLVVRLGPLDDAHLRPLDLTDPWLVLQHLLLVAFNGPALVTLFFVLSGAVLAMAAERETQGPGGFWVRRLFRLYPLLVLAACVATLLQATLFGPDPLPNATTWFNEHYKIPPGELSRAWAENIIGLRSSLNSPAWSIKVEILGSLLFPLLLPVARSPRLAPLAVLALVAGMFLLPGHPRQYAYMNLFTLAFLLGALVPLQGHAWAEAFFRRPRALRLAVILVLLLAMMGARRLFAPDEFTPAGPILVETLCATALVGIILYGRDHAAYRHPWATRLALASFGLYLLHLPILFALAHLLLPHLPETLPGGAWLLLTAVLALATLAIALPLAWWVFRGVEQPMQQLGRRLAPTADILPNASVALASLRARRLF